MKFITCLNLFIYFAYSFCYAIDRNKIFDYGNSLALRGEYKLAAEEYCRGLYYEEKYRTDTSLLETMLKYAEKSEDYDYALKLSKQVENWNISKEVSCVGSYYRGRIFYNLGEYNNAYKLFNKINKCTENIVWKSSYYKGLCLIRQKKWDEALEHIRSIEKKKGYQKFTANMVTVAKNGEKIKLCSPAKARIISLIVPGSGYFYAHCPKSGIASLLTIGLLTYGAVSAFESDNNGTGILLSVIDFGWYLGGMYGAGKASKIYNKYIMNRHIEPLEIQ